MYFQKVKFHISGYNLRHTPGADPESGKRGGTLLKKVEDQKRKVTTIIASYNIFQTK